MPAISDHTTLNVWETASTRHPLDRLLVILAGAYSEMSADELATLDVQERDRALLDIRRETFGDALALRASCRSCGAELEFETSAGALMSVAPTTGRVVEHHGWQVVFRLPNSIDLASAISGRRDLFAACVTETRLAGEEVSVKEIPDGVRALVEEAMSTAAPASDIEFVVACEECQTETILLFDPGELLWRELSARARRLLTEIVLLARAFGWDESQILSLSARRRRTYLEAVS